MVVVMVVLKMDVVFDGLQQERECVCVVLKSE